MTISEAYRLFVEERQVNGVPQKTLMFYRDTAEKFAEFVGLEVSLDEASKGINQYFLGLRERELSQASIHTHWRAVKTFWRFAFTEGYIDHLPKLPRIKLPLRETLRSTIWQGHGGMHESAHMRGSL